MKLLHYSLSNRFTVIRLKLKLVVYNENEKGAIGITPPPMRGDKPQTVGNIVINTL